jgi:hypothetical protein
VSALRKAGLVTSLLSTLPSYLVVHLVHLSFVRLLPLLLITCILMRVANKFCAVLADHRIARHET